MTSRGARRGLSGLLQWRAVEQAQDYQDYCNDEPWSKERTIRTIAMTSRGARTGLSELLQLRAVEQGQNYLDYCTFLF